MKLEKIAFVHSHIFLEHNNTFYSDGKLSYKAWERYLQVSNKLVVLARSKEVSRNETVNYNVSSGNDVEHISLPNISGINRLRNLSKVKITIKDNISNCDLVVVRLPSEYGLIAVNEAIKLNIPYVIELVGDVYLAYVNHGNPIAKLVAPLITLRTKKVIKNAPYVLYVTKRYLQKKYPSKFLKITTECSNVIVDIPLATKLIKLKEKNSQEYNIGLIGSYNAKYKGIEDAFRAIKNLKDEGIVLNLRILGNGNKDSLIELSEELGITNQIFYDGTLPSGKPVLEWLCELDLYIQPSHTEGLPRALIEAMACGLPCIASNVGGIPELLPKSALHHPKNVKEITDLLREFYLDSNKREEQIKRNKLIVQEYAADKLEKKRNKFFLEIIKDIKVIKGDKK